MSTRTPSHVLLASLAAGFGAWLLFSDPAPAEPRRVRLEVSIPADTVPSFDQMLASDDMARLESVVDATRLPLEDVTTRAAIDTATELTFRERYRRLSHSRVSSLVLAPQLADAASLVRDPALNPRDVALPPGEVELLAALIESHADVIRTASEQRDLVSHRLTLQLAAEHGLIPVASLRDAIPAGVRAEIAAAAAKRATPGTEEYAAARRSLEAIACRKLFDADSVLLHRGQGYLAPAGTVAPHLREYDEFVRHNALSLIHDVLALFARNGALTENELGELLHALDGAARQS